MHQDLLQLQACQNLSDNPKTQVPKIMIFWDHLDWCLGACWPKLPISREHFWAITLSLDRNDINNFGPKGQSFQNKSSHEKRCFNLEGHLWYASLLEVDKPRKKKLIVMSCTWKIWLSLNENQQEKMLRKWWKNYINTNRFSPVGNCSSV